MDINQIIARRLRELRADHDLSLVALADRSGVSRSNISLIERGESSATATVLDKLAAALGVTLASLFERPGVPPTPVSRRKDQHMWTDPDSGYVRRNLSPTVYSPIQLVEVNFPAGERVAYETSTRNVDVHQQVWIIAGSMKVFVGDTEWTLTAGDCLAMRLDQPITFYNPTSTMTRYLVALAAPAFKPPRREDEE